jgi:hypothetical protein
MDANTVVSGSRRRVSSVTAMTGRADVCGSYSKSRLPWDGPATDGVDKKILAAAKACQQRRIIMLG